jgi:hypothetical protein
MEGKLLGLAAGCGDDEDVVIAVAVGGEGDPVAVRAVAGVDVAGCVVGEALDVGAVFIGGPDVA